MAMALEDQILANLESEITGRNPVPALHSVDDRPRESLGAIATEAVIAETQSAITALHVTSGALTAAIGKMLEQSDREMRGLRVRLSELQELINMAAASIESTTAMLNDFSRNLSGQIAAGSELARRVVSSSETLQRELRGDGEQ